MGSEKDAGDSELSAAISIYYRRHSTPVEKLIATTYKTVRTVKTECLSDARNDNVNNKPTEECSKRPLLLTNLNCAPRKSSPSRSLSTSLSITYRKGTKSR